MLTNPRLADGLQIRNQKHDRSARVSFSIDISFGEMDNGIDTQALGRASFSRMCRYLHLLSCYPDTRARNTRKRRRNPPEVAPECGYAFVLLLP